MASQQAEALDEVSDSVNISDTLTACTRRSAMFELGEGGRTVAQVPVLMRSARGRDGGDGTGRFRAVRRIAAALIVVAVAVVWQPAIAAAGDDYPHKGAANCAGQFGTYSWCVDENGDGRFTDPEQWSSRNFAYRNCTDWVAWRLNNTNGVAFHNHFGGRQWGNANTWDDTARALGYAVNSTPAVGAVAQTDAGGFGHVAWVRSVNAGGTVTVEDYNCAGTGVYAARTVAVGTYRYIHIKDLAAPPKPSGSSVPFGHYDTISSPTPGQVRVRGWSADPDAKTTPTAVHVYVGGKSGTAGAEGHAITANVNRPDVGKAYPGYGDRHGFDATFTTKKTGNVEVCVYAINIGGGSNPSLGCKVVRVGNPNPFGHFDLVSSPGAGRVRARGWAADPNVPTKPISVHVYIGGRAGTKGVVSHAIPANVSRPDVGKVHPSYGAIHGFDSTFTTKLSGNVEVCAYAINSGPGSNQLLGCKVVKVDPVVK